MDFDFFYSVWKFYFFFLFRNARNVYTVSSPQYFLLQTLPYAMESFYGKPEFIPRPNLQIVYWLASHQLEL